MYHTVLYLSECGDPGGRVDAVVLTHGAVLAAHERAVAKGANLDGSFGRVGRHATSTWHESHQRQRGACVGFGEPLLGRDPGSFGALAALAL
eukprot:392059-Prymnesium_polylepis.1